MTSLALIFILLLVSTLNNQASEEEEGVKSVRDEVRKVLERIKNEENLSFTLTTDPKDPLTQIITLDEGNVKYEYNRSELKEPGRTNVTKLFSALAPRLCSDDLVGKLDSVILEGHTDKQVDDEIEGKLDNLSLSQSRAYSVMEHAFRVLNSHSVKDLECLRQLATATGRGSTDLKRLDAQNAQEHAINRRVEIKVRVRPGVLKEDLVRQTSGK